MIVKRLVFLTLVASLISIPLMHTLALPADKPWPPGVQKVSDESPVLSPQEAMKTFFLPPGYRMELVASEPMIETPILIDWDADGRLWVVEQPGFMQDLAASNERQPLGRVSVLEDVDGDGKMDKKTVFMDGLVLPRALKVLDKGVLIGEPPNLWYAQDTNGDGRADTKQLVANNYGQGLGNIEHNANGLTWAIDNWIYTSEHDSYLRLKNGKFENRPTLARGQWGVSQDDAGRLYRNTNEAALFVDLLPERYFMRNPNLVRTRGSYESLNSPELNTVWPVRPTPGVNRGYQEGILRPDGTLARFTAVCAPTVYRGDRLPREIHGNVFVAEPAANLVSRIIVADDGTGLRAQKAYANAEFLASTDERFRPSYLSSGPDGALYVVDTYHGIIQHSGFITEYLRDQILSRKLDRPLGHGRIYRIVHESTQLERKPALSGATPTQLVATLSHPNGWWRDTAQRLLVERGSRSVAPQLTRLALGAKDWRTRLHALWTLDGMDAIRSDTVLRALDDPSRDVRVGALRIADRWVTQPNHPLQAAVLKRASDPDWAVRRQLAATLGSFPAGSVGEAALITMLEKFGDDPLTVDAALSGLTGREAPVLQRLLSAPNETPQLSAAITVLAATVVKSGKDDAVQHVLRGVAEDGRPNWQRMALLGGAEAVLTGAPLPGTAGRATHSAAAMGTAGAATIGRSTAASGAGEASGGARAFPQAYESFMAARAAAGATAGGRGGSTLSLSHEPAAFTALARGDGELSSRAKALLARLQWPGKAPAPGAAPPVAPLTPAEQRLFGEGRTLFASLCVACHGDDGRGRDKLGPSLVGSQLALAPPTVPIQILLHGKEGPIGLMPPLGATLTDEQIAAVLTYMRREWGNAASAVGPGAVKDTRAATAARSRPWTNDELLAPSQSGQGQR